MPLPQGRFVLLLIICLGLWLGEHSCGPKELTNIPRAREVWALNTILDQQVRMLSLALNPEMYVAYHTESCRLYQIWKGGIHLDGAPFKDIKTLQPTSWGTPYWKDSLTQDRWVVETIDSSFAITPAYQGYRILADNQVRLRYGIPLPNGSTVSIEEQPEYEQDEAGNPVFKQLFRSDPLPPAIRLTYRRAGQQLIFSSHKKDSLTLIQTFSPLPPQQAAPRQLTGNRGKYWMDRSGCNTCHELEEQTIGPGYRQIASRYGQEEGIPDELVQKVKQGGAGNWGEVPMVPHPHLEESSIRVMLWYILSLSPVEGPSQQSPRKKRPPKKPIPTTKPGFGTKLTAIHPAYDLSVIRPEAFKPRVGALAFMPDSSLLLTTWDSIGGVYRLYGVTSGDTNQIRIERIAQGLAEPLGIEVVEGEIYVLQKQELTHLVDLDGDGITDEYRNVCNSWDASIDFHEYSYGLVYKEGTFWANLGLAMRLMPQEEQLPDRGKTIIIHTDGRYEWVNSGLRQPNGIGWGPEQELFISENQGNWVPACKLIHVQKGVFHGCRLGYRLQDTKQQAKAPAVWLPQDEIGNSPGEPVPMQDGPYAGQLLLPEVTHGGIKRIFLEKIAGEFQGCVFRFSQGLGAGVIRLVWGPDGALYTGGVGMNGNWGVPPYQYGLNRLQYNAHIPFEMLKVKSKAEGMQIVFTHPLRPGHGEEPTDYLIQQWRYEATENYGGPKLDLEELTISSIHMSEDRRSVSLTLPQLKTGRVVYIRLADGLMSEQGEGLWSSEVWYTLNAKADAS
ncbi:MAG: cytochrome C [Bacteroidota bacterium]